MDPMPELSNGDPDESRITVIRVLSIASVDDR
jgi:hypothetical protein